MDKWHIINRDDIPYFQDWIRKVSGKRVWIRSVDEKWAIKQSGGSGVPPWFWWGDAWAGARTVYLNIGRLEAVPTSARYLKAVLLHEMGHISRQRKKHGRAGWEYIAQAYALNKASKLGLEAEREVLFCFSRGMRNSRVYGRNYRIAYRMLRNIGAV